MFAATWATAQLLALIYIQCRGKGGPWGSDRLRFLRLLHMLAHHKEPGASAPLGIQGVDWAKFAKQYMPHRDEKACREQWQNCRAVGNKVGQQGRHAWAGVRCTPSILT